MAIAGDIVSTSLFRIILPITLLAATLFRFNGFSFTYLVCLLFIPLLPSPSKASFAGHTGRYLQAVLILSTLVILIQAGFQIYLAATPPYGHVIQNCTDKEAIFSQIGLQRFDKANAVNIVRLIVPDVVVWIIAVVVYLACRYLYKNTVVKKSKSQVDGATDQPSDLEEVVIQTCRDDGYSRIRKYLDDFGDILISLFLAGTAIAVPSVISGVYFLSLLVIATWWACYKSFGRGLARYRIFLVGYTALHMALIYLYQLSSFQGALPTDNLYARILGLTGVIKTDCSEPWQINFYTVKWQNILSPLLVLVLYYISAMQTSYYLHRDDYHSVFDTSSVYRHDHPKKKSKTRSSSERQRLVDTEGSPSYNAIEPADDITPRSNDTTEHDGKHNEKRSPIRSVFVFLMGQGYLSSIIVMLCWSVVYHSWLSFVFLLVGCIVLIVPKSRTVVLHLSPIIVLYAEALLICQYIYGMNLTEGELPEKVNSVNLKEVGLVKYPTPMGPLAIKIVMTFFFWLTMRQFMRERHLQKLSRQQNGIELPRPDENGQFRVSSPSSATDTVDGYDSALVTKIGAFVRGLFVKYWIFVCAFMMMFIAVFGDVVIWRVGYMIFLLLFLITLQVSYRLWRLGMYIFWWILICYSMVVLIMIYTYQFDAFPGYWKDITSLNDAQLKDIGLEHFSIAMLLENLLMPTIFLIVIILQVHYFHTDFMKISALEKFIVEETRDEPVEADGHDDDVEAGRKKFSEFTESVRRRAKVAAKMGRSAWIRIKAIIWRAAEIHIWKIVFFTIVMVAVNHVSAVSVVFIILTAIFLPFPKCHGLFFVLCMIWCGLVVLAKMAFQLSISEIDFWYTNCTHISGTNTTAGFPYPFNITADNARYFGLEKTSNVIYYLKDFLVIILFLSLETVIKLHQKQYYLKPAETKPKMGVIFPETKRADADKSIIDCIKFLINFCFYKFGLEICYITSVIVICTRLDAFSVIYTLLLAIFMIPRRQYIARMWPIYVIILSVIFPIEFLSCIGLPPGACIGYPWDETRELTHTLERWLYLPDYIRSPDSHKLIGDFFQLLFVCLQCRVFALEGSARNVTYEGGTNRSIIRDIESNASNPVHDFISKQTSFLCVIKSGIFQYLFWVTLAIIFVAGTTSISIFHLGYLLGSFVVLWNGQDLFLKPIRRILHVWNGLLIYNVVVIFAKCCLQLVGCVYLDDLLKKNQGSSSVLCVLVQLLNVVCIGKQGLEVETKDIDCVLPSRTSSMFWDGVVFCFLLIQLRIFKSHYFRYVVLELQAQNKLASRGAELINMIIIRDVEKQKEDERNILARIKRKMEKLKLRQTRLHHRAPYITTTHDHYKVIRSGDYYMFDDDSSDDDTSTIEATDTVGMGLENGDKQPFKPLAMIHTAVRGDGIAAAVEKVRQDDAKKDEEEDEVEAGHEVKEQDGAAEGGEDGSQNGGPNEPPEEQEVIADQDDEPQKLSKWQQVKNFFTFIWELLKSGLDSLIDLFDQISKNYRIVAKKIDQDKIHVKEAIKRKMKPEIELEESDSEGRHKHVSLDIIDLSIDLPITEESLIEMEKEADTHEKLERKSRIFRLLNSVYQALVAKSELICYFVMVLNILIYASVLALLYPASVFLWAMLSIPRPAKRFWLFVITYTQVIVVLKYFFQFNFWPWNDGRVVESPYWPPRILGIEKANSYATFDLVVLLTVFIHRSILKRYGLWKDEASLAADMKKVEISRPNTPRPLSDTIQDLYSSQNADDIEILDESQQTGPQCLDDDPSSEPKKSGRVVQFLKDCKAFISKVLHEDTYSATTDVYAPMFFCDFISFFIVVFGYKGFGPPTGGLGEDVTQYFQENKIPVLFLIMLLLQFVLIIIDRALYLKKLRTGKFIYQLILVVLIHVYIFFVLPAITERRFVENLPAQLWYFTKCVYFGLSSYQIRCGYPTRILGNFLTKKYSYINLFLFKGFLVIPFLLELRALMDWIWTDTTMALSNWLQVEDIYANVYVLKCWRSSEDKYPTPRGLARTKLTKYGSGIPLLCVIIFIIWFPLVLFSFANSVFDANPPIDCVATISLGNFQYIFKTRASSDSGSGITAIDYEKFKQGGFQYDPAATNYLNNYEKKDTRLIKLTGNSTALWEISPPSQNQLIQQLNDTDNIKEFKARFHISFTRSPKAKVSDTVSNVFLSSLSDHTRQSLAQLIATKNTTATNSVLVPHLFPRFIHIPTDGKPVGVKALLNSSLSNVTFYLQSNAMTEWWEVKELLFGDPLKPTNIPYAPIPTEVNQLTILTFSDRTAPAGFSLLTGYGILGLYVSIVFVVAQFAKVFTRGLYQTIMFEELPYVDRVLKLCLDIYMVRESGDLEMEEELFSKLIFLYRSPETLIKWSKPKQN